MLLVRSVAFKVCYGVVRLSSADILTWTFHLQKFWPKINPHQTFQLHLEFIAGKELGNVI